MSDHHATASSGASLPTDGRSIDAQTHAVSHLSAFQRDILAALPVSQPHPQSDAGQPHGLAVKTTIETWYGSEVNHGRLYPNIDELAEKGYLARERIDKRTKAIRLTDAGKDALGVLAKRYAGALEVSDE
jgi:hypothetical protein